ncbi:MAG: formate--phosphoribosylaminoimidazolecarboxamide ligase family protein [Candidatus Altiarchaeales archaeon]|nr:formate--phosphoribosylaminoimidazolecarboxamide ligase family protein [Candidatus Altiarchaeota archaeon]MBU4341902.1 formate--phosphoribosylaminoimidazolecarboxamide ligase family protein [Candidatus Altiarchaeota archaeon]MCG2782948.1 formate--phosphoribosylaminoimidazolecarboxamide ligase family protein [Candidatus Altiarchaeales archaeon]
MISQEDIGGLLNKYNLKDITVGALGSHSALDICRGAKEHGFRNIVVCQKGREKTYERYYKSGDGLGVVDETIILEKFANVTDNKILTELQKRNTIFLPHRSFEVYVGFDKIENEFLLPLFGSRAMLRAEERDAPRNQYYLMEKAGIPFPRVYKKPDDIDRLVLVKVSEAHRTYERAFFFASSPEEYQNKSDELLAAGTITEDALKKAVVEEFVVGAQVNFNYFYSPLDDRLELLGTDTRRQTNLDGILRLPAKQQLEVMKYIDMKTVESGHIACTVKESLLEQIFELGEKFVKVSKKEYAPGIIGPFALQATFTPGPPKEIAVVFDISLRVQGSPGTKFTPYSEYLHGRGISVGERIAMELKKAVDEERVQEIVT